MPRGKKKELKINNPVEEKIDNNTTDVEEKIDLPEKAPITEVEVGVDLTKDGTDKVPIALIFECEQEQAIHIDWEYKDGTRGNFKIDAFPIRCDIVGRELKKTDGYNRAFSNAYCILAKRILKCNAAKVYAIY